MVSNGDGIAALRGRPLWTNLLLAFCAYMTFVYVPWDLFVKPLASDREVWFGIVFEGVAAKLLAIPHWVVYAAGTVGFLRLRRYMWPWAAVYAAQVTIGMVVWPLVTVGGVRGVLLAIGSGAAFGALTLLLWRSRGLFQPAHVRLGDRYGGFGLVTGASSGIGREFAHGLASEGLGVVLTARRADRLSDLAVEIEAVHGVATRVIPLDLGAAGGAEQLVDAVRDLEIAVLVNNAGFGAIGEFTALAPERVRAMVELNCVAPAVLSRLLLPAMKARGRGAVIFVGSVAGMLPMPFHALYSATKGFDDLLGEALFEELRGSGVDVLALEPGSTDTEFQQTAGERPHGGRDPRIVVDHAILALGQVPSLIPSWRDWLRVNAAIRLLSRPLLLSIVRRAARARLPEPEGTS